MAKLAFAGIFSCVLGCADGTGIEDGDGVTPTDDPDVAGEEAARDDQPEPGEPRAVPMPTSVQPLLEEDAFYPRAIELDDGTVIASVVAPQASGRLGGTILESTDHGATFNVISRIDGGYNSDGVCCGSMTELRKPFGALPAGALLWAISAGNDNPNKPMRIPLFASLDRGHTWVFQANVVTASKPRSSGGLWEPELSQLEDGSVVCHYADETHGGHSQKLVARRSTDGLNWNDQRDVVALTPWGARPGMPVVRRGANGHFVLSFEICGTDGCAAHLRFSADGWNWGNPNDVGLRPATMDGKHFRHAMTIEFRPDPGPNGRFYMIGQMLYDVHGGVTGGNGWVVMANTEGGHGRWYELPAPVPVADPFDNFCPNYSPAYLPLGGAATGLALEITSAWDNGRCRTFFARSLQGTGDDQPIVDGDSFTIESLHSDLCLDLLNGDPTPGTMLRQWWCNGSNAQRFRVEKTGDGAARVVVVGSNQCLTIGGTPEAAGVGLIQQPCDVAGPGWQLENIGLGYYRAVRAGTGVCLDVAGGSFAAGAPVQQWHCNDLAPQIWRLTP